MSSVENDSNVFNHCNRCKYVVTDVRRASVSFRSGRHNNIIQIHLRTHHAVCIFKKKKENVEPPFYAQVLLAPAVRRWLIIIGRFALFVARPRAYTCRQTGTCACIQHHTLLHFLLPPCRPAIPTTSYTLYERFAIKSCHVNTAIQTADNRTHGIAVWSVFYAVFLILCCRWYALYGRILWNKEGRIQLKTRITFANADVPHFDT